MLLQQHCIIYNTIQYNTIHYNTIQYNTIQYNTIQYNAADAAKNNTIPLSGAVEAHLLGMQVARACLSRLPEQAAHQGDRGRSDQQRRSAAGILHGRPGGLHEGRTKSYEATPLAVAADAQELHLEEHLRRAPGPRQLRRAPGPRRREVDRKLAESSGVACRSGGARRLRDDLWRETTNRVAELSLFLIDAALDDDDGGHDPWHEVISRLQ